MVEKTARLNFNRGIISRLGLGRQDLERTSLSAETQRNWIPRVLGSMMLRPGLGYLGSVYSDDPCHMIPFVFASDDKALLELTASLMRVWIDGVLITRASVTAAVTNGTFGSDVTSWTDADESGATSAWVTGGYMGLTGNGYTSAIRRQTVTCNETSTEHALRIVIARGPVTLRVGSTTGGDEYITETNLGTGTHSLAFTPTGNFDIQFSSRLKRQVLVDSVAIEGSGTVTLPTPWVEADLPYIRHTQSGDIVYVACEGYQQYKIERRAAESWSVVKYQPEDGPFRIENLSAVTLTPSAVSGNITLTASNPVFRSTHVGALFSIDSVGQTVEQSLTGANQFSGSIRVTGVDTARQFTVEISGTWSATVTLQRSVGEPGAWVDVVEYTGNTSSLYDDGLDNQTIYYRIGIKTGNYTSGTAVAAILFSGGSLTGVVRITAFTSSTSVSAEVLTELGETNASELWAEGIWSDYRGWPSAVALYEGRMWWCGKGWISGSISDSYESYDPNFEGDARPILRTIGEGPVDVINWVLPLQRFMVGTLGSEVSAKSTSFDEPLTADNFSLKRVSSQGSAKVAAIEVDSEGIYVQRSGQKVYQLAYDAQAFNYTSVDLTALAPELAEAGVVELAVQRQPDTRVHCVLDDGTVALMVYDDIEQVRAWVKVSTDGEVENVVVLPGTEEDEVYYVVKRTINSATVRYLEKWALESEARGGSINKIADSFKVYSGASTTSMTGLSHLEGESVVVWANSKDLGSYTVTSGAITLSEATTYAVIGLSYTADYKSGKLSTDLTRINRVSHIALLLADTHASGVQYGPDFDTLDDMPLIEAGTDVDADYVWDEYHEDSFEFNGTFDVNSRVCLRATAPKPATVLALVVDYE